jgi:radical SAM-linked protein
MPRLLFEKTGEAVWISHLDLMRLFQRAFKRAGLELTHTQGYNPRPSVSIALPLSVGVESVCELLDFDLEGERVSCDEIRDRLNQSLVKGVRVLKCYDDGKKIKELAYLQCNITLEYDSGIPVDAEQTLCRLFSQETLPVEKKSKNGMVEQDIIPMIRQILITQDDEHSLRILARICCQNPSLNPMQLVAAIERYAPACIADHAVCRRIELYDINEKIFR